PSVSVRPTSFGYEVVAGSATPSLGWKVGVPLDALAPRDFAAATGAVDALLLGYFDASPAELPYTSTADAVAAAAHRVAELRLQMSAYRMDSLPADGTGRRQLFEFARRLNIEMIIA